jgi:DNA-binding MarR family transcriptional regulator
VTLNIDATSTEPANSRATTPSADRRRQLIDDLTAELTSWNPREFILMFQRLHRASLSIIHLNVLTVLEAEEPMSMGQLAELMDVSVASMTGIVTRMEARGMVERVHDDRDRRVVLVRRAEGGHEVFRGIEEHRREGLRKIMGHLSDEELAGLLLGHRALRTARVALMRERAAAEAATTAGASDESAPSGREADA